MSRTNAVVAIAAAAMLVLAGCTGGVPGGADGGTDGAAMTDDGSGTVTLYVSDQPGAMGDFEHLNVTIDRVAYHHANASDTDTETDGDEAGSDDAEAEDAEEADTEAEDSDADANETSTADEVEAEDENGEAEDEPEEREGWESYDINETTVDLTELQGENATVVGQQRLPNGTYDKVFLYVSDVNGTLDDGNSTKVKLPSGKLQLEKEFTVGNNESMDFVFDATVVKAGQSGKYILTPVVSESGTDVPIKEVGRDEESGLSARFAGSIDRGEAATVKVTQRGEPVSGATVEINDQEYTTAGDGTVMFDVPADAEEVEVEVEYEDGEVELKRTFGEADEDERDAERDEEAESDVEEDDAAEGAEDRDEDDGEDSEDDSTADGAESEDGDEDSEDDSTADGAENEDDGESTATEG